MLTKSTEDIESDIIELKRKCSVEAKRATDHMFWYNKGKLDYAKSILGEV